VDSIKNSLQETLAEQIVESTEIFGVPNLKIAAGSLLSVCEKLHSELGFDYLADITAIDFNDRIEVVYQFTNLSNNSRVALRLDLDREKPEVDSLTSIWKGADFQEREVFDLMGVVFKGHPNLTRILLPLDWEGHPLRKDYVIDD
jgi:NADH-quinone oxidoreductase subunit C